MAKKIVTVLGARPQFIKSKPLTEALKAAPGLREVIVHTGQHYDFQMYQAFLKELKLPLPKYSLGVAGGSNLTQVQRTVKRLLPVLAKEQPQLVVVYGDTNATLAGALAAKEAALPLAHIEAGLRSFRLDMAEELNRLVTDSVSDLLFAPVSRAVDNLRREGIERQVYLTGDVLCDVMRSFGRDLDREFKKIQHEFAVSRRDYYLLTLHRAEAVDCRRSLRLILESLQGLDRQLIFPLHPRTKRRIKEFGLEGLLKGFSCLPGQPYLRTLSLIENAKAVLTDSGGIQREAYMLKTPCLTLRDETEWRQTLEFGWNRLVKIKKESLEELPCLLKGIACPKRYTSVFGQGQAAAKIVRVIERFLAKR